MDKKIIHRCVDKKVKLVTKPSFALYGKIIAVFDECIEFKTEQGTSYIDFEKIIEIMPLE